MLSLFMLKANAQTDSLALKFPTDSGYLSSFDGTKIYYEVSGEGKPVLLIHGFIVNSNSWKHGALYTDLLNAGYKVIVLDMRGNGKSDKPHDSLAYDNDAEAKDIMLLMDKLKIKSYAAVGYSRGSIITARLLVLDKRVKAAVMGGMGTDFTNPEWPRRIMFYHAFMGEDIPEAKGAVDYARSQNLDLLALAYMQRSQPSTPKEVLQKVKQPVLVICGNKDSDNGSAGDLAKLLQNSTFATVPGDHNHASGTKEFADAVKNFLFKNY
ncbi:alpha/beta hydrolase [Panacibacter ginsenosidivorans]|uniref:Alpha/beta hydrolase n=2 Tax=Panacibacter ginsenosidivorans TaxID=1813871 RepID=A0A5B8VFS5_9BACT|nr:alpha/beta hydrolase [Panacibacter ginsenosidivorans]